MSSTTLTAPGTPPPCTRSSVRAVTFASCASATVNQATGSRRVTEGELRATFGVGWRVDSLTPDRFDINPGLGTSTAEAWLADIVSLAP